MDKQDVMHKNAQSFNEDCERFDSALEAFENDVIPQSAWIPKYLVLQKKMQ